MERIRFTSLDVFRGLTICLMIVVNMQGEGAYPILGHADWFGFTMADIVFPSFLFAMGNALAFGKKDMAPGEFWLKTLRRVAIIFALGYLLYWFPFFKHTDAGWVIKPIEETRIMGVLQRLALCYGFAAIAARYLGVRGLLVLSAVLLLGYWGILLASAPPELALTKTGNIGNYVDQLILGKSHLYPWDEGFEPEGLLGTIPATVNVILGYLAGLYIRKHTPGHFVMMRFIGAGVVLILAAVAWGMVFPIGKKLWTSSFVLLTVGIDLIVLAGLIAWIDQAKQTFGVRFFEIFGKNPLIVYLFSELLAVISWQFDIGGKSALGWVSGALQAYVPGAPGALLFAVFYMLVCWLFAWVLHTRKIVIKV